MSAQTAAPAATNGIYNTLTTNELSGSGDLRYQRCEPGRSTGRQQQRH
ncbi:hypothetical protein [Escherichia coli]